MEMGILHAVQVHTVIPNQATAAAGGSNSNSRQTAAATTGSELACVWEKETTFRRACSWTLPSVKLKASLVGHVKLGIHPRCNSS